MTEEIKQIIRDEIKTTVNGKIDRMTEKLDAHIQQHEHDTNCLNQKFDPDSDKYILRDVLPIIEAYRGSKMLGELLKWLAGVGMAYLALKKFFV